MQPRRITPAAITIATKRSESHNTDLTHPHPSRARRHAVTGLFRFFKTLRLALTEPRTWRKSEPLGFPYTMVTTFVSFH